MMMHNRAFQICLLLSQSSNCRVISISRGRFYRQSSKPLSMRRGREIPGAFGVGKVQIVYKPKKVRKWWPLVLAFIIYGSFIGTYFTSFWWKHTKFRAEVIIPAWKGLFWALEVSRQVGNYLSRPRHPIEHDGRDLRGENMAESMYLLGYRHASTSLFRMEVERRCSMGTLEDFIHHSNLRCDPLAKSFDLERHSENLMKSAPTSVITALLAYSRGVNAAIEFEYRWTLPLEFHLAAGTFQRPPLLPWLPVHSLGILNLLLLERAPKWDDALVQQILARLPDSSYLLTEFLDKESEENGVNTSQVSGAMFLPSSTGVSVLTRSSDGKTTLASQIVHDQSHHSFLQEVRMQWMNMKAQRTESIEGVTLPGVPFFLGGRSGSVAWSWISSTDTKTAPTVQLLTEDEVRSQCTPLSKQDDEVTAWDCGAKGLELTGLLSPELLHVLRHSFTQPMHAIVAPLASWLPSALDMVALNFGLIQSSDVAGLQQQLNVHGSVRMQLLCTDTTTGHSSLISSSAPEVDLSNYQLVVASESEEHVSRVHALLQSGQSMWEVLNDDYSVNGHKLAQQLCTLLSPITEGYDEEEQLRAMLCNFDGHYSTTSVGASLTEVMRTQLMWQIMRPHGLVGRCLLGGRHLGRLYSFSSHSKARLHLPNVLAGYLREDVAMPSASVESAGGVHEVVSGAWRSALRWLRSHTETKDTAPLDPTRLQWGLLHVFYATHPASPWTPLLDEVLGAGPELAPGGLDTLLAGHYIGGSDTHSDAMLHMRDMPGVAARLVMDSAETVIGVQTTTTAFHNQRSAMRFQRPTHSSVHTEL